MYTLEGSALVVLAQRRNQLGKEANKTTASSFDVGLTEYKNKLNGCRARLIGVQRLYRCNAEATKHVCWIATGLSRP